VILHGLSKQSGYFFDLKNEPDILEYFRGAWINSQRNAKAVSQNGIAVVMGSGAGSPAVFYGLSAHEELRLLVSSGLSPMEALLSATRNAAKFIGSDDIGTIATGKLADLIIVEGNPLTEIGATKRLWVIIKGGNIVDRDSLLMPIPERPQARVSGTNE